MKNTFAAASFTGIAVASSPLKNTFVNWMSSNNKHYTSTNELNQRAGLFAQAVGEVNALNAKSAASGKTNSARFETNFLADLTDAEKNSLLGLNIKDPAKRTKLYNGRLYGNKGRKLVADATTIDHVADGFMYPVKDQGGCGSCYAFAANTALEGYIARKNNSTPVRLSEQHLVDCTLRKNSYNYSLFGEDYGLWGCGGGWMATCWYFQHKNGVMKDSDYSYTSGSTGTETKCAHDSNKTIGKVIDWGQISQTDGIQGTKDKLATHPLTIAIDAG